MRPERRCRSFWMSTAGSLKSGQGHVRGRVCRACEEVIMTEDVLVSIRGLHTVAGEADDDIEVIFPGTCRKLGDTLYVRYSENVEGMEGEIRNLIKLRGGNVEVTKRGLTSTHMVFEEGKKNVTWYETPMGSVQLGISATDVEVTQQPGVIDAKAVYALEVNAQPAADCSIFIRVSDRSDGGSVCGNI